MRTCDGLRGNVHLLLTLVNLRKQILHGSSDVAAVFYDHYSIPQIQRWNEFSKF